MYTSPGHFATQLLPTCDCPFGIVRLTFGRITWATVFAPFAHLSWPFCGFAHLPLRHCPFAYSPPCHRPLATAHLRLSMCPCPCAIAHLPSFPSQMAIMYLRSHNCIFGIARLFTYHCLCGAAHLPCCTVAIRHLPPPIGGPPVLICHRLRASAQSPSPI